MDNSQSKEICGEPEPHSTCELPPPPPLFNRDPRFGPRIGLRILVFPFPPEEQDRWADHHNFDVGGEIENRRLRTVMEILRRLPRIVITTNATPQELERGMDLNFVKMAQEVMATDEPPFWVKPCAEWCVVLPRLWFELIDFPII
ncbi:hypothetical protein FPV67DRAFT_1671585 [Lyophyllum atratum]|nr:hypothetical protein FPV67DRAFT_1671585 [Lyophyllum atratum]